MIIGIGTDIVRISRVAEIYNKHPEVFPKKILSDKEIENFNKIAFAPKKIAYLSKRFAAKEAFVKALGTGFRDGIGFSDIRVVNNKLGKPYIIVSDKIKQILKMKTNIHLSIADETDIAAAFVVIEEMPQ